MTDQEPEESEYESRWWELDLRSLALFRVLLGLFVLLTLASFWGDTSAFFTDAGVLPRVDLVESPYANLWLCFHMGSGTWLSQAFLNALLGFFAVGLMAGWRTPWMVAGCWILLNSLQVRNPFVGDRGDLQLSLMLFWAFFLPLGAAWSADAKAGRTPWGKERGLAAAALVTQFGLIYLFAAYYKNGPFWLTRGDGLEHSLISPLFATDFSLWLAESAHGYLRLGNYSVIAGELFVAMLLLCPWTVGTVRPIAVALLLLFHLGVAALFQLGLFPWIGALLPLALLPKEFWEGWGRRLAAFGDRRFGEVRLVEPPLAWEKGRTVFLLGCLLLAVSSNFLGTPAGRSWGAPGWISGVSDGLRLSQHWDLFSPIPPYYGTFRLQTAGADAKPIFEGPPTREKPGLQPFPSHRWRMLMLASLYPTFSVIRPGVVKLLAQRAGVPETQPLDYSFWAEIPDDRGKLKAPEEWKLWVSQSQERAP